MADEDAPDTTNRDGVIAEWDEFMPSTSHKAGTWTPEQQEKDMDDLIKTIQTLLADHLKNVEQRRRDAITISLKSLIDKRGPGERVPHITQLLHYFKEVKQSVLDRARSEKDAVHPQAAELHKESAARATQEQNIKKL